MPTHLPLMLLARSTSDAPWFTSTASNLAPFLTKIAELAVRAGVPFSSHIKLTICYANLNEAEFWEMLSKVTSPSQDWGTFMQHIIPDNHHHHSDQPIIIITTALTTNTKPNTLLLQPIIPTSITTTGTTKSDTDPNTTTLTTMKSGTVLDNLRKSDPICHHLTITLTILETTTNPNNAMNSTAIHLYLTFAL
ncbi:hypothetical protein OG21DRAFT_1526862 [Imleria badia]|nr:hypothetical protein OG21DRAFT_1526862 [Imleria badia]